MTIYPGTATVNPNTGEVEIKAPLGFNTVAGLRLSNYTPANLTLHNIESSTQNQEYLQPYQQMVYVSQNTGAVPTITGSLPASAIATGLLVEWSTDPSNDFIGTYPTLVAPPSLSQVGISGSSPLSIPAGALSAPIDISGYTELIIIASAPSPTVYPLPTIFLQETADGSQTTDQEVWSYVNYSVGGASQQSVLRWLTSGAQLRIENPDPTHSVNVTVIGTNRIAPSRASTQVGTGAPQQWNEGPVNMVSGTSYPLSTAGVGEDSNQITHVAGSCYAYFKVTAGTKGIFYVSISNAGTPAKYYIMDTGEMVTSADGTLCAGRDMAMPSSSYFIGFECHQTANTQQASVYLYQS